MVTERVSLSLTASLSLSLSLPPLPSDANHGGGICTCDITGALIWIYEYNNVHPTAATALTPITVRFNNVDCQVFPSGLLEYVPVELSELWD